MPGLASISPSMIIFTTALGAGYFGAKSLGKITLVEGKADTLWSLDDAHTPDDETPKPVNIIKELNCLRTDTTPTTTL
ncbi:hypothetical protein EQU50_04975 [Candidatus Finniella inopinata]|uniref:Uncharacterized protein n=1 Tax=Candidatus Finniella inopinata TaxID=1696036 RepID=A0A4Q7DH90_9PROT|nr:hypothetical protein EQU50_04975 [Candidatus Finniella inopinata]